MNWSILAYLRILTRLGLSVRNALETTTFLPGLRSPLPLIAETVKFDSPFFSEIPRGSITAGDLAAHTVGPRTTGGGHIERGFWVSFNMFEFHDLASSSDGSGRVSF